MAKDTLKLRLSFHNGEDPRVFCSTHNLENSLVPKHYLLLSLSNNTLPPHYAQHWEWDPLLCKQVPQVIPFLSVLQHNPARESHYWDFRDSDLQANFSLLTNPTTISINFLCNCINMHENIVHKVTVLPLFHQFWYQQEIMAKIPSKLKLQTLYLHVEKPPCYLPEYPTFPPFNPPRFLLIPQDQVDKQ